MYGFKSAILEKLKNCQNGTFKPVHEFQKKILSKAFFWSIMKMAIRIFFHNLSQGPPNPGFIQEKVQKGDFLKKDSRELFFFSCFRFLWISRRPGTLNWERVVFLPSKSLYRKCEVFCFYCYCIILFYRFNAHNVHYLMYTHFTVSLPKPLLSHF